ncbi:hypothetical protein Ocin01_05375 [Orchesella cincta]|uniref:Uncharacterized protein n=1 Tax=Orchesella cincta TaxID=48709 RepID=A0A1D2N7S5_ORCCI|nr:hypothetical protein Ocin01_05375 [Orchesella cincta]
MGLYIGVLNATKNTKFFWMLCLDINLELPRRKPLSTTTKSIFLTQINSFQKGFSPENKNKNSSIPFHHSSYLAMGHNQNCE